MQLKKPAVAGTLESSDCMISIAPSAGETTIELHSDVETMFGDSIRATVKSVLKEMGVENAEVVITDKGALDCVIRARLQCAVTRSAEVPFDWSKEVACHA